MRNLKTLGLAFVALLALNAMIAASASADDKGTAESYPVTLTGGPDPETAADLFVTTAGQVTCPNPSYDATVNGPTSTIEVSPNYGTGCKALGFPATIHQNGCTYLFHLSAGTQTEATVDLKCPAGKEITITANPSEHGLTPKCVIHVKEQLGLGTVTVTNAGAGSTRDLTLDVNITGIHYTHTGGSPNGTGLGACTSGTGANGTLAAKATITGEKFVKEDEGGVKTYEHVGIFLSAV